jgi:hypothetical protein
MVITTTTYIIQFINVVLISCITPANWSSCLPVHRWVPPYIQDLHRFKTQPPYSTEKHGIQLLKEYERLHGDVLSGTNRT